MAEIVNVEGTDLGAYLQEKQTKKQHLALLLNVPVVSVTYEVLQWWERVSRQLALQLNGTILVPSIDVRDTTGVRNEKWRTYEPESRPDPTDVVEVYPTKIVIEAGDMTIKVDDARDGFRTMVYIDGVDVNPKLRYRTVDVRFREGEPVTVTMECCVGNKNDPVGAVWPPLDQK